MEDFYQPRLHVFRNLPFHSFSGDTKNITEDLAKNIPGMSHELKNLANISESQVTHFAQKDSYLKLA